MSDIFDEIFNIPEGLILTEKQRKNLDNLDIFSRFLKIKSYKAQQGLGDEGGNVYNQTKINNYQENVQNNSIRQNSFTDKVAEAIATSNFARKTALAMQGITDSYLNPVGLALRTKNYIDNGDFSTGIEHIEPQDKKERLIEEGAGLIYETLPLTKMGRSFLTQYDKHKFGNAYKKVDNELLEKIPGNAEEIMATYHNPFGRNTYIQRGAVAYTDDGKLITQGAELKKATQGATKSNYGLTKEIGLHNMSEADVRALPEILDKYKPIEKTNYGQWIYEIIGKNGKTRRIVTNLREIDGKLKRVIVSDYWVDAPKTPIRELLK